MAYVSQFFHMLPRSRRGDWGQAGEGRRFQGQGPMTVRPRVSPHALRDISLERPSVMPLSETPGPELFTLEEMHPRARCLVRSSVIRETAIELAAYPAIGASGDRQLQGGDIQQRGSKKMETSSSCVSKAKLR